MMRVPIKLLFPTITTGDQRARQLCSGVNTIQYEYVAKSTVPRLLLEQSIVFFFISLFLSLFRERGEEGSFIYKY